MIDLDEWDERAAVLEYDQGMTRFAAETEAAKRQGFKRWEALNAKRERDTAGSRNNGPQARRDDKNNLPRVQSSAAEQDRPVPKCDVPAGRNSLEMLALPISGGTVL